MISVYDQMFAKSDNVFDRYYEIFDKQHEG